MKKINKSNNENYNKFLIRWMMVILVIAPVGLIASYIGGKCVDGSIFSSYIELLISNYIYIAGGLIWGIGCLIIQGKFLFVKGKYKSAGICFIILIVLCAGCCKSAINGYIYQNLIAFTKDLSYLKEKSYCEKIEKLNKIYKTESNAKGRHATIFVETESSKYQVFDNIVDEDNYDEFKSSFKKCKNVKIKYLPNTNFLLSIEPLEDQKIN